MDVRLSADGQASFAGLGLCGSVWACPTCSAKIQATRRDELTRLQAWAEGQGYTLVFGTATLRHTKGQSLAELWGGATDRLVPGRKTMSKLDRFGVGLIRDAQAARGVPDAQLPKLRPVHRYIKPRGLTKCFTAVRENSRVRRLRRSMGFVGYVRVVEATYGDNGWHPHIHVLYLFDDAVTDEQIDALADAEFAAWSAGAKAAGLGAPLRQRYELTRAAGPLDSYFTKSLYYERSMSVAKVGQELASAITKRGKHGGRTPFQILADYVADRRPEDLALWTEWERTSYGRRAMTWSRGLKVLAGIYDVTDEEIADADETTPDRTLFVVADWCRDIARRGNAGELADGLLRSVEADGKAGGLTWCAQHAIETYEPTHEVAVYDRMAMADQRAQRDIEQESSDVVAARAALRQGDLAERAALHLAVALDYYVYAAKRFPDAVAQAERDVKDALCNARRATARLERMRPEEMAIERARATCEGLSAAAVEAITASARIAAQTAIDNLTDPTTAPTEKEGQMIARHAADAADMTAHVLTLA